MNVPREELLGTRYERIFTWVLDLFFAAVIGAVVGFLLGLFGLPAVAYTVVGLIIGLLYGPVFMTREGEANGQTPAKQLMGLRVVKLDGTPMGFGTAFIREGLLKYLLGSLTAYLFLLASWALSLGRSDRRTAHDRIAGTVVAATEKRWMSPPEGVVRAPSVSA